jgi:hypothetical protein
MWNSLNASYVIPTLKNQLLIYIFFEYSFSFWWAVGFEWDTDYDLNNMMVETKIKDTHRPSSWRLSYKGAGASGIKGMVQYLRTTCLLSRDA